MIHLELSTSLKVSECIFNMELQWMYVVVSILHEIVNKFYVDKVFVNLDEKPAFSHTELIVTNPKFRLLILEKVKIIICKVKYMDFMLLLYRYLNFSQSMDSTIMY